MQWRSRLTADTQQASHKQRAGRWIALLATAALAGLGGFYSAHFVWRADAPAGVTMAGPSPITEGPSSDDDKSGRTARRDRFAQPSPLENLAGVGDPCSPLPTTPQSLLEEATRVTEALAQAFADEPDALEVGARLLHWFGRSKQAVELWEECLRLDPEYAHAHAGLGMVAAAQEDHAKAVTYLRKAVDLQPGNFPARASLANSLIATNQSKEAIAVLEDAQRRDPRSQGFFLLGQAYTQIGELEKARENFEAAIQKYPEYGEAYYRLATVYARLGQQEKARQAIQKSRELKAEQRQDERVKRQEYDDLDAARRRVAETYTEAASIYFTRKRRREAERLWRRAALLDAKNIECRQGLAWLCWEQLRVPESISWLKELAALRPNDAAIWFEIGRMHGELNEFAEAAGALGKAVELEPGNEKYRAAHESAKKQAAGRTPSNT